MLIHPIVLGMVLPPGGADPIHVAVTVQGSTPEIGADFTPGMAVVRLRIAVRR